MSPLSPAFAGCPTPRHQRGAMSTLAAIGLAVAVASALLAVNLGSVFYTRRHLQTVADTAALSAVNDLGKAYDIAIKAAGAKKFPIPGTQGNTLETIGGSYDYQTRTFTAGGNVADQNAVRVDVSTQQPYFFMLGSRQVTATATAARTDVAGLSIGTGLIDIDTQKSALLNGLLGGLLKTSVNLDVMSYKGLANTNVSLLDLIKAQGSGDTSLVRAYVGEVNADAMTNVTKPAKVDDATIVSLTGLLGVTGLLDVTTKVELNLPGAGADLNFSGPFDEKNTQRISGLSTQGLFAKLGSNLKLYVELLGITIDVGNLLKPLLQLLAPVFGLLDSLLAPQLVR